MLESVGLIARLHDMAVMGEPVQERRRHLGIAKHAGPLGEAQVRGDGHAGVLVQLGEQVKQQRAAGLAERQVTAFGRLLQSSGPCFG